ncbi:YciI family protein [Nocardia arizonensis]|uniref:YciI family protein n=1 Tax=Nocardia arizonensis TaxID=1141647 RepID=UPI0006CFAFF0|nr:YciI family protein [Nocardia arizonensis]
MPIFAVHYTYSDATVAARDTHRPDHRAWLNARIDAGLLLSSGPYPDGSGALLIFRDEDETSLEKLLTNDPFAREGLIEEVRVVEWLPVMGVFAD